MQNTSSSSVASTKLGTAVNRVEKNTMIRSGSLLRIRAAMLPKTVPSSSATTNALNARYGLDRPLPEQFIRYMNGVIHGDFGVSLKNGRPVLVMENEADRDAIQAKINEINRLQTRSRQITDIITLGHPLPLTPSGKLQRWKLEKEIEDL